MKYREVSGSSSQGSVEWWGVNCESEYCGWDIGGNIIGDIEVDSKLMDGEVMSWYDYNVFKKFGAYVAISYYLSIFL